MNFCANCKHFDQGDTSDLKLGVCHKFPRETEGKEADVNFLVTGIEKTSKQLRPHEIYHFASTKRIAHSECGTEGKFYEPKNGAPAEAIKPDPSKKPKFWKRMFNLE